MPGNIENDSVGKDVFEITKGDIGKNGDTEYKQPEPRPVEDDKAVPDNDEWGQKNQNIRKSR